MYISEFLQPRSIFEPGNGHIISSEYETLSVQLKKSLTVEKGTLIFTLPADAEAGDSYFFDVSFNRILDNSFFEAYEWNQAYAIEVTLPSPLPALPNNYVANYIKNHPIMSANIVGTVTGGTLTYSINLAGVKIGFSGQKPGLVASTITQAATNGLTPNVGAGSAMFYRPEDNITQAKTKVLFATFGYPDTSIVPEFLGFKREKDEIQDKTMASLIASSIRDSCTESMRRGTMQVPLEQNAPSPLPSKIGIVARFAPNGAFLRTGGCQIVNKGVDAFAPPLGTILVERAQLLAVTDNNSQKSAIVKLF